MSATTKKCPMCAEEIPLSAARCAYCGAQFEVTGTGYCQHCHEVREADGDGQCKVCNNMVLDLRLESRYIEKEAQELPPAVQPKVTTNKKRHVPSGVLAAGLVLIAIGAFLVFGRSRFPAIGSLFASATPTATQTLTPTVTPSITPTRTPSPTPSATPLPSWVPDFSDPILAAIKEQPPRFQDDFSTTGKGWYEDSGKVLYGVENGVLSFNSYHDSNGVANAILNRQNFVLQVDCLTDYIQIWLHARSQSHYRMEFGDQNWFAGSSQESANNPYGAIWNAKNGGVQQVLVIKRNSQLAIYLNDVPVAYFDDPALTQPQQLRSFQCMKEKPFICSIDNVKFWDLDKVPNLP